MTMQVPDSNINYDECEKEPVTMPGAIQSYGGLVSVLNAQVTSCSANIGHFLPQTAKQLLHTNVHEASPELAALLRSCPQDLAPGQTFFHSHAQWVVGVRRSDHELLHIEFFTGEFKAIDVGALQEEIDLLCLKHHYPAKSRQEFVSDVCEIFQRRLGFDQVFFQVLQDGGFMEIIAEANNGNIEPVLGLHFSSKEIPSQARALYLKQRIRFKQAAGSTPVDLVGDEPVDLSNSLLREPSRFMTVYMQNISASTLLSASIVVDNELVALLTMHNRTPLFLDPRIVERLEHVVRKISRELNRIDELIRKDASSKLFELLLPGSPLNRLEALEYLIGLPTLGRSLNHSGAAVVKEGKATGQRGDCPASGILAAIAQRANDSGERVSQTLNLSEDYGFAATALGGCAGVMTVCCDGVCVLFFRNDFPSELKWRTPTPAGIEKETELPRFSPTGSFQFLLQEFTDRCRPWSEKDIAFGNVIAQWIADDFDA